MGLSFPSYEVGLGSDPRVLGRLPRSRAVNYPGRQLLEPEIGVSSEPAGTLWAGPRAGGAGGSHPRGFQLAQRSTPQAQAFPGEFRAVRASTGGGAGLRSIRRAARPLWATGLCCWNDGACLPACAAAAAAPRRLPRRPRRVGMCMSDVLERAGGWGE